MGSRRVEPLFSDSWPVIFSDLEVDCGGHGAKRSTRQINRARENVDYMMRLHAASVMVGSGNPLAPDEEEDESEKDKAVSGLAQTLGCALFVISTGILVRITPEAAHGQQHDGGTSTWFIHQFSWAATFLAWAVSCVLLFYTLAKPGPSRQATKAKIRIAGIGLFWLVLGGVPHIYLSLPPSYWTRVIIGLTFAGLIISAIYILYPWLCGSTWTSTHEKSKPNTTKQYCCLLQYLNAQERLLRMVVAGEDVDYVISSEVNQHEEGRGKTTTGGTNRTQRGIPIQGSCGVPSQHEDIGDPLSQSNQRNQQPSTKGKQAIEETKTVRPHQALMERAKGNKEEPNQMMEMMKFYGRGPEINPDKWPFVASSQRDCITPKYFIVNDRQSSRVNGTKRTQKSTPVHGGSDVPYPLGVFGDPLALLNQTNQQLSSRKGKQDKEIDKTVKPCKAPVDMDKGIKEEPRIKVINLLDKLPEITRNYDEWRFAVYLLLDCISQGLSIENEDPSHIANWIKLKCAMDNNQPLKVAFAGNEEARGELSSMMRMPMPI